MYYLTVLLCDSESKYCRFKVLNLLIFYVIYCSVTSQFSSCVNEVVELIDNKVNVVRHYSHCCINFFSDQ